MSLISISNLTFGYDGSYDNVFEDVSFQIDTDWKLGFIGRNGRGKTTLLNLLLGKYEYNGIISKSVDFQYFPYGVADKSINTIGVIENICFSYAHWELIREMSLLEVCEDVLYRPFETLSNGEQTKVLLVALFLKENSFLLIDEPTNHLDVQGRKVLSQYLKSKKAYILVSHDRAFLDGCVDHILSINKTNIEVQHGNFTTWSVNKEQQDNFEFAQNKKLKKEIKRLEKTATEKAKWSNKVEASKKGNSDIVDRGYVGHKAAKMMKHSKALEARQQSAIEEKSQLLKNIESSAKLKLTEIPYHSSRLVILDKVSIFYDETPICQDISFTIEQGDRIALQGKNGSGKSSILKLISGKEIAYTGNIEKGSGLVISYVSQYTSNLRGHLSEYARNCNIDESIFKSYLRKLGFSRAQFDKDIEDFSGGQKKKVLIAKSLCEQAHLYIWDEPLNFIDVISRMQIEELLLEFSPTILFVEHDSLFCSTVANKIVTI